MVAITKDTYSKYWLCNILPLLNNNSTLPVKAIKIPNILFVDVFDLKKRAGYYNKNGG
ncbi:MAG: hypothetical protein R2765_10110 [Ferruginibacter sp.]